MSRKFRLGQSRDAQDLDAPDAYAREGKSQSKRRQRSAERLVSDNEAHDADAMLLLPDPGPWLHLPEATLVWRHSQIVDLELDDGTPLRASLAGKLKGVKLVVGDRLRYSAVPLEPLDPGLAQAQEGAQVVAVMPRRTLLKRGGIDDREPWQLICANADELWVCAAVVDPPLRPGLLERAQTLALACGLGFRIIVTKRDPCGPRACPSWRPARPGARGWSPCANCSWAARWCWWATAGWARAPSSTRWRPNSTSAPGP
jgi:ribosome biogenesis GTPase